MQLDNIKLEAINHLQNLIRIDTTNPPGNEMKAIRYVANVLAKEKIPYQIFESAPERGNLVARIKGNGSKRPLLLTSHVDVVPAEAEQWKYGPFSGEMQENCIWGRGAVDMKQMTAMELVIFLLVQRSGVKLSRDLILAVVCDEEAGCRYGSQWLVENKPALLDAEYALNEVGGFSFSIDGNTFYPIGVAEKGVCWFKIVAKGDPGHGSMPHENQALVKLAQVVQKLGSTSLPFHSSEVVKDFISTLASKQKVPRSWILKALLVPWLNQFVLKKIFSNKRQACSFHAMLHNTVSPTVVKTGDKINVIPAQVELRVDGRIIPGQTIESFLKEVRQVVSEEFDIEVLYEWEPTETKVDKDFYDILSRTLIKHDPRAIPVPYLIPGFTDAAPYSRLGIQTYGFAPVRLNEDMSFTEMFHGHNERIPVDGYMFGIRVLWDVVREVCEEGGKKGEEG